MTPNGFRRLALSLPDVIEASHMRHPDFRVGGRVFATMGFPNQAWGLVKLTSDQQAEFVKAAPKTFVPVAGKWGLKGNTNVRLSEADKATLKSALMTAWENLALKPSKKRGGPAGARSRTAMAGEDLHDAFARVRAALKKTKLPEVEESMSFGTFSMKLRGKFLMRVKDQDTLVFRCPIEEKSLLMATAPNVYFETDHYQGGPAILVRLAKISDAELKDCLERAWRLQAPATLVRRFYGATAVRPKSPKRRSR
jgi:hypothetical protein